MTHFRLPLTLQFAPGESLRWTQRQGVTIEVLSGRLWLTHSGDPRDHFVHPGERCTLRRERGSVIGAEGPVAVRIEAAGTPLWRGVARAVGSAVRQRLKGADGAVPGASGGIIFR